MKTVHDMQQNNEFSKITDILKTDAFQNFIAQSVAQDQSKTEMQNTAQTERSESSHHAFLEIIEELKIARTHIDRAIQWMEKNQDQAHIHPQESIAEDLDASEPVSGTTVEGVFDGEQMRGNDNTRYFIPANYASKSKLVEGDVLKLTITPTGAYVYKQVQPIERKRITGTVKYLEHSGLCGIEAEGKLYSVLKASLTFFKLQPGSRVSLLIPQNAPSTWCAIENKLS